MITTRAYLLTLTLSLAACYNPDPADGAFRCSVDFGNLCPTGLYCGPQGLCISTGHADLSGSPLDLAGDTAAPFVARSCEDRIRDGAFSNLTALAVLNTAADEEHLALDSTASAPRVLFQRAGQLYVAAITGTKMLAAPIAVTLTGAPASLATNGGSFTPDGHYWFSGTSAGTTSFYEATPTGTASFSVGPAHAPISSTCAYNDPSLGKSNQSDSLYTSFALSGCTGASYAIRGAIDRNLGDFYSALPDTGWAAPNITPSGLGLLVSSTTNGRHLYQAQRSDPAYQFDSAARIPMTAIGESTEDRQAVVGPDCLRIFLSSVRTGGAGGADLYVADIAAE